MAHPTKGGLTCLVSASLSLVLASQSLAQTLQNDPDAPLQDRLGFWSPTEQETGYRSMERIFPTHPIKASATPFPLPTAAKPLEVSFTYANRPYTTDDFIKISRVSGLLVIKDGAVVLERYGLGRKPQDRWTSFSIAKSLTSTLVGAALRDGAIKSLDDPASRYVPALKGGVYDNVTIRNMLTMQSGVHWDEDYDKPNSDFNRYATMMGPSFFKLMSALPRDEPQGDKFHYSTAESNLIGAVVMGATGKSLADYASEKIWRPFGMETDGVWMVSTEGFETGGICFSATLRDYGRFGLFILGGGKAAGKPVLADGWLSQATKAQAKTELPGVSYGYQWWVPADEGFEAVGIMGQTLFVDPAKHLVVVIQSAWSNAGTPEQYKLETAFVKAVAAAET